MGKRTGGKRGAPAGNRNRLKHGRYCARQIARRAEVQALLRRARNLIRRIEMMAWARKALRRKRSTIVIPGRASLLRREGKGTQAERSRAVFPPGPPYLARAVRAGSPRVTRCVIRGSPYTLAPRLGEEAWRKKSPGGAARWSIRSICAASATAMATGRAISPGLMSKLDYIASLGVDAIWLSPIHPSPNRDWGYDVSDYEGVHPDYGTLADFDALIAAAHAKGIRVLLDEVLCHTSDEHAWFQDSLKRGAKSDWYVWADPAPDGTAPNNWLSAFGGPAWAYQPARRQHYHHKFLRQQPKLSWRNADAKQAALDVLDLWLKRGADGFRLDVANAYLHDDQLRDNPPVPMERRTNAIWGHAANLQRHIHDSNLPENVECLKDIRRTVEQHADRFVFGEFSEEFERSGAYLPGDVGLHASYTFSMLRAHRLSPDFAREDIETLAKHPAHWPCVTLSNHDIMRTVTRFGGGRDGNPALAKLMLALLLSLRGTVLLYQGEELGLPEVDLRRDQLRDPVGDLYYPDRQGPRRLPHADAVECRCAEPRLHDRDAVASARPGAQAARRVEAGWRCELDAQLRAPVPRAAKDERCAAFRRDRSRRCAKPVAGFHAHARKRARALRLQHERREMRRYDGQKRLAPYALATLTRHQTIRAVMSTASNAMSTASIGKQHAAMAVAMVGDAVERVI